MADVFVEAPDGKLIGFPEGTSGDDIARVMKNYAGGMLKPSEPSMMDKAAHFTNAAGTAATKGFANLLGMGKDLPELASAGGRLAAGGVRDLTEYLTGYRIPGEDKPKPQSYVPDIFSFLPSSADLKSLVFNKMGVPEVNATSRAGKLGQAALEGATSSPFGALGMLYGALSGGGSEAAGQGAEALGLSPGWQQAARVAGGVLAPLPAMAYNSVRSTPARIANDALDGVTPQQLNAAQALMDDARARGINLTAPEAIAQVTGGNMLQETQRSIEASRRGGPIMRDFLNERPAQNQAAMNAELQNIGPNGLQPAGVARQVSTAAEGTIDAARTARTNASRPWYEAAAPQPVNPADFQGVLQEIDRQVPLIGAQSAAGQRLTQMRDRIANAQTIGELDMLYKETRDALRALPNNPNAVQSAAQGTVGPVNTRLGDSLRVASPELDTGRAIYEANSPRVDNLRQPEVLGRLSQPVADTADVAATLKTQANAVLNPASMRPQDVRRIAGELRMTDPQAFSNLMRTHLENTFNKATENLVAGENQWGAAKFAKEVVGNQQGAANLQAAIESLPNGQQSWNGLRRVLDIFEAQGKRLPPNSSTFGNLAQQQAQSGGGMLKAATRSPFKLMADWYDQFRLGANSRQLATWMTDPRGVELLRQAAMTGPNTARATAIATELMAIGRDTPDQ